MFKQDPKRFEYEPEPMKYFDERCLVGLKDNDTIKQTHIFTITPEESTLELLVEACDFWGVRELEVVYLGKIIGDTLYQSTTLEYVYSYDDYIDKLPEDSGIKKLVIMDPTTQRIKYEYNIGDKGQLLDKLNTYVVATAYNDRLYHYKLIQAKDFPDAIGKYNESFNNHMGFLTVVAGEISPTYCNRFVGDMMTIYDHRTDFSRVELECDCAITMIEIQFENSNFEKQLHTFLETNKERYKEYWSTLTYTTIEKGEPVSQ